MHSSLYSFPWLAIPLDNPWFTATAIIAATFIHEDIATVATGMLVADGVTSVGVALPALYAGIVAGDLGLYGIGRLVALNRISERFAGGSRFSALKLWLDERVVAGVFLVRFLPGLRMPAYTTYGFFAMPFKRFVVSVIFAAKSLDHRAVLPLLSIRNLDRGVVGAAALARHHLCRDPSTHRHRTHDTGPCLGRR